MAGGPGREVRIHGHNVRKTHVRQVDTTRTAQGVYIEVLTTVTNTGDRPWSFFERDQKLKDKAGREFGAGFGYFSDDFADGDDINPGNKIDVVLDFDVPTDMELAAIVLHDSAFSRGATVDLSHGLG
jgi:Domain of unknown function (DUF4352)